MKQIHLTRAARVGALAAIPLLVAAPLAAQGYYTTPQSAPPTYSYGPPPQSGPPVFSGLDCSRCSPGATYCVINPIRFEYTCAPQGTYACAGITGTSFCRYGTTCWDGHCR